MNTPLSLWFLAAAADGVTAERLWLLGGVAVALTGAGVVALAAARGRGGD
ncbi:hypothetical protein ACIO1C_33980 [Streptomyces sp. NPDC087420]